MGLYCRSAEQDTGQALTQFRCVLVTPPPLKHRPDRTECVCGRSLAGIVGSKLASSWCPFLVNFEFLEVQFYGPECSIVQIVIQCGVMVKL